MTECGCDSPTGGIAPDDLESSLPWWRDRSVLIPVASGTALVTGLLLSWSGQDTTATILFWTGLLLGGSQFVPGAVRRLFTSGRAGIGLLMTISATGAVLLGYIEEAAALAFLYSIAEALEDKAMDRARSGLRSLLKILPQSARIRKGDQTMEVPVEDLRPGDLMEIRPGEKVPTDGVIRRGYSSMDTSAITGESIPVAVAVGDTVNAGSINSTGALIIEATAPGTDNSLTTIVSLVEQAQSEKGERARLADRIARPLVPGVLILALLVGVIGSLIHDPDIWITRALVVLVAASPCAMAISVPVTVTSAIGAASRFGVIFKSGAAFEHFGNIRHLAMDKTGTLTRNQPSVVTVLTIGKNSTDEILRYAASVEHHSTHPLAQAITTAAPATPPAHNVEELAGHGITGVVDRSMITVGNPSWLDAGPLHRDIERLEAEGITMVVVHRNLMPIGVIGIRDELRAEAPETIRLLNRQGIDITMLTGDNHRTATTLAAQAGITRVRAGLRPEDKSAAITELSRSQPTGMIGDGINDAPALTAADVGIAMGTTGSDAAIESADVAFTGTDLRLLPQAFQHARRGRQIINQNITLSLLIIIILLPLSITGVLGLAAVVLIHEVAEVIVILNGLRAARVPKSPTLTAMTT